jgi:hypothetical protein
MTIELKLPKVSLNEWYSGKHWTTRKRMKDVYKLIVGNRGVMETPCECLYSFEFKSRPLDASNCVAMVKLVEDCLFEDDGYDKVIRLTIESKKGKEDSLTLTINKV